MTRKWVLVTNKPNLKSWELRGDDVRPSDAPVITIWTHDEKTWIAEILQENPYYGVSGYYEDEDGGEEYIIDETQTFGSKIDALRKVRYWKKKYRNK